MHNKRAPNVSDDRLLRREAFNPNDFDVIFERDKSRESYVEKSGISLGPSMIECKSKGFAILNHGFYIVHAKDGKSAVTLVWNFGKNIGVGNMKPSLPFFES